MKTLPEFKESLNLEEPITGLCVQLRSLWYNGKGIRTRRMPGQIS